jgi:hypothetical protein
LGKFQIISYGVDLEKLDAMIAMMTTLAGDFNLYRQPERAAEALIKLERKLSWRLLHLDGYVFTRREVEAMQHELYALSPTEFGPQRDENPRAYICRRMAVTKARVSQLLKSANELMYYHAMANPDYVGWMNVGRKRPQWQLQVPTAHEAQATLRLVKNAVDNLRKIA